MNTKYRNPITIGLAFGIAAYLLSVWLTIDRYGPSWDSALGDFYFGERLVDFWQTFDSRQLDFRLRSAQSENPPALSTAWVFQHPEHFAGFGPTASAFSAAIFRSTGIGPVEARHLWLAPLVACLAISLAAFSLKHFGGFAAIATTAALLMHPRLWADAHNNIKDIPAMVFFSLSLLSFATGAIEAKPRRIILGGLYAGLSLAAKPNVLLLPAILLPWMLCILRVLGALDTKRMGLSILLVFVLTPLVFFALSPHLLIEFPTMLLRQVEYFRSYGLSGPAGWSMLPAVNVLVSTPLVILGLLLIGLVALIQQPRPMPHRLGLLVLLWLSLPIVRVSLPHANDFDGIRHYWEFWPAAAIVAGLGANWTRDLLQRHFRMPQAVTAFGLLGAIVLPPALWIASNVPYGICFYNALIGGLKGAQARNLPQATDYWGSSYRQGIEWLNQHAVADAELIVGVAPHIVSATAPLWLRPDIHLAGMNELTGRPRYLMFITRRERYPAELSEHIAGRIPVYQIKVDGGVILEIYQLSNGESELE